MTELAALHIPAPPLPPADLAPSPIAVCDVLLDVALTAGVDMIWLEPHAEADDRYDISLERDGRVVAATSLDGGLGAAVVARLALIADIDLVGGDVATGRCAIRGPSASAEILVTTRSGRALRGEVMVRRANLRAVPAAPIALVEGATVGNYRIAERLGAGGMGEVFRVVHVVLERSFALKVLHGGALAADASAASAFQREARAAARIRHPSIVDVFDFGHLPDGRPYLVMEYLSGHSLARLIEEDVLGVGRAVSIARQLASALAAAHDIGVIHADLSPANVLVVDDVAKVVDFGLARLRDDPARRQDGDKPAGFVYGTPSYIAPEMIRGLGATEASDQYALGAVLYEMLAGRPPFEAPTVREVCLQHLRAAPPPIARLEGAGAPTLQRIVARCLAKRPEQRFPSMAALESALTGIERSLAAPGWRRWLTP